MEILVEWRIVSNIINIKNEFWNLSTRRHWVIFFLKVFPNTQMCTSVTVARSAIPIQSSKLTLPATSITIFIARATAAAMGQATAKKGSGSAQCAPRLLSLLPNFMSTLWVTWVWSPTSVISVARLLVIPATCGLTSRYIQVSYIRPSKWSFTTIRNWGSKLQQLVS